MSMDFSVKPTSAPVVAVPSTVGVAINDAVKTELRAPLAVEAVDAPAYIRNDPRSGPDGSLSRQIVIDKAAASFVYQTVDTRTNEVITQFPDDAILRRRAYFQALDRQEAAPQPVPIDRSI